MENETGVGKVITLPENTTEDYDEVIYVEDDPEEVKKAPKNVADYLWRTINYHLQTPEDAAKNGPRYSPSTRIATQLCYARGLMSEKFGYGPIYHAASDHLFSLDTVRDNNQHFNDCGSLEKQQGARFMYGYLAYLVALDEGK